MDEAQRLQDQQYALERWKSVFGQYEVIKSTTYNAIVRSERAKSKRYDLLPLYFLRKTTKRGEVLEKQPENLFGTWVYGLDSSGRVVAEQMHLVGVDETQDIFFRYTIDFVETVCFFPYDTLPRIPLDVSHFYFSGGHIIRYISLKLSGVQFPPPANWEYTPDGVLNWLKAHSSTTLPHLVYEHENYIYEGDRLTNIERWSNTAARPHENYETEEKIIYSADGTVQRIDAYAKDKRYRVLYQKPETAYPTIRENTKTIVTDLIKRALAEAHVTKRVFKIVLYWHVEDAFTPVPIIHFLLDEERLQLKETGTFDEIWFTRAHHVLTSLDPVSEDHCQLFEQETSMKDDWFGVRDLLREVAAELTRTKTDWTTGLLSVAEDFIVYVLEIDLRVDSLKEALLSSVDDKQLEQWRIAGYLPDYHFT